jgi:hypothetical protein
MTALGKSSIRMELSCSASMSGAHEHPSLMSPDHGTPGSGLLLFFRVDDFDLALQRARSLVGRLEEEPHVNPNTQTKSSRSGIRTDITLRSVRYQRRKEASQLPSSWPESFIGQRSAAHNELPSP